MTEMASLLAIATVFMWHIVSTIDIYSQRWGLIRETKLSMQGIELKVQEGV